MQMLCFAFLLGAMSGPETRRDLFKKAIAHNERRHSYL